MEAANKKWYQKWWGILLIIIFALLLSFVVAFGFYVHSLMQRIQNGEFQAQQIVKSLPKYKSEQEQKLIEGTGNYWLGATEPIITIVEFADFACPFCKNSFSDIREISLKYKKYVKIIFRDYPMHENSIELAMASRCAGEQGLFWPMHDKLFQNQGQTGGENGLIALAIQIGADTEKFQSCLTTNKYLNIIKKNYSDAKTLKIKGTPTWFLNGYKIEGSMPHNLFIQIIEELIRRKAKP